jgi:WD40 repeat protein/serine/threonine protein kinase
MSTRDDQTRTGGTDKALPSDQNGRTLTSGTNTPSTSGTRTSSQTARTLTVKAKTERTDRTVTSTLTPSNEEGTGELLDKVNWEIGDVIDGRYRVIDVIGQGGKGIVYKVNHLEWQVDLAVKMPLADLVFDEASKARFIREAQTWVALGLHPNIVQCWYIRELGGMPRVFMDYIDGGSLKDWLNAGKVKPGEWGKILDLAIQACDGLGYAHEHGVEVHRDVKPGNLLMTENGQLLVTDFGIAKRGDLAEIESDSIPQAPTTLKRAQQTITVTGSELGTPEYGAPEQWGKARYADRRADIYGLGVVLFELCCGRRPFDDGSHTEPSHVLIGRHLSTPAPDPREINPNIPQELVAVILRCLEKKPDKRPDSMTALRKELVSIYEKVVEKNYRRLVPQLVELRSDMLNNRAVSLLDLGERVEAFESWKEALRLDPYHPESIYNKAILEWRECKITDEDVIKQLEDARQAGRRAGLYLGFAHLERTAADEAEDVLIETLKDPEFSSNGTVWKTLGDAQIAQEKYTEAEYAYQKALELIPGDIGSLEGHTLAQLKGRHLAERLIFPWQHCCCSFEGGHQHEVAVVAITPNGRFALSSGQDKMLRLWDLTTRVCLWATKGHEERVSALAITPDGQFAVTGSQDRTVRFWGLATGKCFWTGREHTDWVTSVAVTPNGRFAITGSRDMTLRSWSLATGKCAWTSEKHSSMVNSVAVTPDGRFVLSAHDEENLYLWDANTGKRVERNLYGTTLESLGFVSSAVSSLTITADGKYAVTGALNAELRVWDLSTGQVIRVYKGHDKKVTAVAVTPDGKFIVSGSDDSTLRLWNFETSQCLWVANKHFQGITAVAITPNGRYVVSASRDTTLRQWDLQTGQCLWTFWGDQGHREGVTSVAITPHERFAVSGGRDMTMRLWDLKTAECLQTFDGHLKEITGVAATPDGQYAISASRDATLWLWELGEPNWLRLFEGHGKDVNAVVVTPDGRFVISGSDDCTVRVWDFKTANCLKTLTGHQGGVIALALSPEGRFVLSGSKDKTVRLWDLTTTKCLRIFTGHEDSVTSVKLIPGGRFIISGSNDYTVRLWDVNTAKCMKTLIGHKGRVTAVVALPNPRFMVSGSEDRTVRLWNLETTRCLRTFMGHKRGVMSVAMTSDGQFIVSASDDGTLRMWNLELEAQRYDAAIQVCRQRSQGELESSAQRFRKQMEWAKAAWQNQKAATAYKYLMYAREVPGYERATEALALNAALSRVLPRKSLHGKWLIWTYEGHLGGVTAVAVTPDGRVVVSGSVDTTLRLWDLASTRYLRSFKGHTKGVTAVVVTPDGRFVVSGSKDATLRLWDLATTKCLRVYEGHQDGVTAIAMTQYGRFIVSGSEDKTLRTWNPATAGCLKVFTGHKQHVTAVAITPDKRFIISGSADKTLRLWNAASAESLQTFLGHKESVTAVEVASNGQYMVSGSADRTLRLWQIASGKSLRTMKGHDDVVTSVAMTSDSRFAISSSKDRTLRLWDLATGACLSVFEQYQQGITTVVVTADGRFVISGSDDKTLRQWELDWELDMKETEAPGLEETPQDSGFIKQIVSLFNK